MKRREFIRKSCFTGLAIAGSCFLFSECKTASIQESEGEIRIPLSLMKGINNLLVSTIQQKEKILVVRQKDGDFHALLLRCTHKGTELAQNGEQLICPAHGSIFDLDGKVKRSPANKSLKSFPVSKNGKQIIVHLT